MAIRLTFMNTHIYKPGGSAIPQPPEYLPTRKLLELLLKLNVIKRHQYLDYMQRRFPS